MNAQLLIRKITSHSLAKDSLIVMIGSMVANVGAYFYHVLMGRLLGPVGYGELSSLLSIFYIFTVPLNVGTIVLVKFISSMKARGEIGQVRTLFIKVTKACLIGSAVMFPCIYIASPAMSAFLHIESTMLFAFVYIVFVVSMVTVISTSVLQGYQKFLWVSILGAVSVGLKLIVSIPAVQFGVSGVLLAMVGSAGVMYILYCIPLRFIFIAKSTKLTFTVSEAIQYAIPTLLVILGMTSLYSSDVILARHFFPAFESGIYSSLSVLGKVIFYASSAVSLVMFPVLSERTTKGEKGTTLIFIGLGIVTAISVAITFLYILFPETIIKALFGSSYIQGAPLLGLFGLFLILYSIGNVLATVCMAIGWLRMWIIPIACACIQIFGILLFHTSIHEVLWVNIISSLVLVIGLIGYYWKQMYEKV